MSETQDVTITQVQSRILSVEKPDLSILVPFYKDDPSGLIDQISSQISTSENVELCIYDDGSNDSDLTERISNKVRSSSATIRFLSARENRGRSFARNKLTLEARADWVLFLDADMRPVSDSFISDYLDSVGADDADVIFGGFEVPETTSDPERELHRAFSEISDCLRLEARQEKGPQYVCSSNLCVRKNALDAEPFDPGFSGWGWEDSEWAARIATKFRLVHANIPALHLGLETTDTLLSRFKESGPNYLRFTQKHPDLARTLTLYKATHKIKHIPGQRLARPILKSLVKFKLAPVKLRLAALKLWRASWYAEVL